MISDGKREELKKKIDDDFLETLVLAARAVQTIGWGCDSYEVKCFVRECYALANKPMPKEVL